MNRRRFLGRLGLGVAGACCAVGQLDARRVGGQSAPKRREVSVGGRRVRTIDVHAHCMIPEVASLVQGTPLAAATTITPSVVIGPTRVREMDDQGIDVEVLSVNPFWYSADRELSARLIDLQNEKLADICVKYPDRFTALASVALQHPDLAAAQLQQGLKAGLRGAAIGGSVNGEELASPRFDPFWAKAEELGAVVFIHPQGMQAVRDRVQGNGFLSNVIGNPLETTVALSHLVFEGTLDRFPGLKICAAHGGGYLPSYAGRSDRGCLTFPANCTKTLKKAPSDYLKQLYFDSLVFTGEGLRHLVAECGASQIVVGTDHPYPWTNTAVDHVLKAPGLTDADRRAILGENAAKLLRL